MLNSYMGAMIQEVLSHNGDVLKFSGDAFFSMWKTDVNCTMEEVVHEAIDCAVIIQKNYGTYLTDAGITLKVKIGIAAGPVLFSIIGNEQYSHYVVVGTPIWDVKKAEYHSNAGEIVISPSAWQHVNAAEYIATAMRDGQYYKATGLSPRWKSTQRQTNLQHEVYATEGPLHLENSAISLLSESSVDLYKKVGDSKHDSYVSHPSTANGSLRKISFFSEEQTQNLEGFTLRPVVNEAIKKNLKEKLRRYIIPPVMRGIDLNEPLEYLTEVRHVVILFINIITDEMVLEKIVSLVNDTFKIVFRIVDEMKGCVNKVSLFDKDYMILCIFGLRGMKSNLESQIALHCAFDIRQNLIGLPSIQSVSCAVTTGLTYCGVVGHTLRREYTVISLTVNKAARLMVAYPNKVTCDRETFLHSKLEAKNFLLQESIELKGITNIGLVYEFREQVLPGIKHTICPYPLLDRDVEINLYLQLLNTFITEKTIKDGSSSAANIMPAKTRIGMIIRGEPRQGKTRLLDELVFTTPYNIPVNHFSLQLNGSKVPYTTIQLLFGLALGLNEVHSQTEREDKLKRRLRKMKVPELLCALNDIFQVRFEYSELYRNLSPQKRHKIKRKLLEHLVRYCFPTSWVFAIDDAEFIDDPSWILIRYIFQLEKCFTILTIGYRKPLSDIGTKVINSIKMEKIVLSPIGKWYHAALACQFLDVKAIPPELEKIIQTRSYGNPGWVESYLVSLIQVKAIVIRSVPKEDVLELGLVSPPVSMLNRSQIVTENREMSLRSFNISGTELHDYGWKMFDDCFKDSASDLHSSCINFGNHPFVYEHLDKPVCTLAENLKYEDLDSEITMDALIMKTFDSLTSYEQRLLKCSAVLGERFLRALLLFVMAMPVSPRRCALAVKKLFEIKVLVCARRDVTEDFQVIVHNSGLPELNEAFGELCHCRDIQFDDSCKDLPKYAQCGCMKFESYIFRETVYSLLTDNQKKHFHTRAIRYLEKETRRCMVCGGGYFARFSGVNRYDFESWNPNQIGHELDDILVEHTSNKGSSLSAYHYSEFMSPSYLTFQPRSNRMSSYQTSDVVLYYNRMNRKNLNCCLHLSDSISMNSRPDLYTLTRFSNTNLAECQCDYILNSMYSQLLIHLRGTGQYDRLLETYIDYVHFCINDYNIPLAMKLLDDGNKLLETQTIYDENNEFSTWFIPIQKGRLHMLTGYAKLQSQQFDAALESLHTAMCYFGHPFPKSKAGVYFAIQKQIFRQKLLLRYFPKQLIHKHAGQYGEFCGVLSDCLSFFYELYKKKPLWNSAKLAGIWCFNEALGARLNFRCVCRAYAIMIDISTYFGDSTHLELFENLSLQLCSRKVKVEIEEIRTIILLYTSIFESRFLNGKLNEAKEIGYVTLDLARKLREIHSMQEILQLLIEILMLKNDFPEVLRNISEFDYYSEEHFDIMHRSSFYAYCIEFILNTGYSIIKFSHCERHRKVEGESIKHAVCNFESEKHFYVNMWLWYVRHSNWEAASLYYPQVEMILNKSKIKNQHSLLKTWVLIRIFEGLIITLVYNAEMHYIEKVSVLMSQIDSVIKIMESVIKNMVVFTPRYYHLKAYYLKVKYGTNKFDKLLALGKEIAFINGDVYEFGYISYTQLCWSEKLSPLLMNRWKEASISTKDWHDLLIDPDIIYFTFPFPSKPLRYYY